MKRVKRTRTGLNRGVSALTAAVLLLALCLLAPPAQAAEDLSTTEMLATLDDLTAFGPRVQGTDAELATAQYLKDRFDQVSDPLNPLVTSVLTYDLDDYAGERTVCGYSYDTAAGKYCGHVEIEGESTPLYGYLRGNQAGVFPTGGVVDCGGGSTPEIEAAIAAAGLSDLSGKAALIDSPHTYGIATAAGVASVHELVNIYHAEAIVTASTQQLMRGNYLSLFHVSDSTVPILNLSKADGVTLRTALAAGRNVTFSSSRMHTVTCAEAVLPATGGAADAIVFVTSHLDSVMGAPGANDNGSGTAIVLEMARLFAGADTGNVELRFVCFGGEEIGLFGSDLYLRDLSVAEREKTLAVLNLDMAATADPEANILAITTLCGMNLSAALMTGGRESLSMDADTVDVALVNSGSSDHESFNQLGIDAMNLIRNKGSAYDLEDQYHTPDDTVDINISEARMGESAALTAHAIRTVLAANPAKTASYHVTPVIGKTVVTVDNTARLTDLSDRLVVELTGPDGSVTQMTLPETAENYAFDVTRNGRYQMKLWAVGSGCTSWQAGTMADYSIPLGTYLFSATKLAGGETVLDISKGNIVIGDGTVAGKDTDGNAVTIPNDSGYRIIGTSTSNTVAVTGGTHDIIIDGVNVDMSGTPNACAFSIASGAMVGLTLKGTNTLGSGTGCAGLQAPTGATLTITGQSDGSGSLNAIGGSGGAGVGGSDNDFGGDVTINGGTVNATGGSNGAGIGGGDNGDGGNVAISGGTVNATGGSGGAGIGGGHNGGGGDVTISGGNVKAMGLLGGENIGSGTPVGNNGTLTNGGTSHQNVYLTILTLTDVAADTPIAGLDIGTYTYGMDDVKTLDGDKLYLYLPVGATVERITTGESPARLFTNQSGTPITVAGNHGNSGTLTEATTVTAVMVSPAVASVVKGANQAFTATVTGTNNPAQMVNWTVEGGVTGTSIDASGNLAIAADETATTLTVKATSTVDTTKNGTVTVTVLPTYALTVDLSGGSGGTTGGDYAKDAIVSIDAGTRSDYRFAGWTSSNGGIFADASSASTAFTMPGIATTITANWTYNGGGGGGGASINNYTLTFDTNGGSSISAIRPSKDTAVDLTKYTPTKDGYTFDGWYSDEKLTAKITSIRLTKNTIIYAGWNHTNHNIGAWDNPFADVSENDWFYEDVALVNLWNLMNGTSDTTFSPYATTTRGMIATILYRVENEPTVTDTCPFDDVRSISYYEKAITWAAANGIVKGYGNDKFGPDDSITREQMAAILYRYAQFKGDDVSVGEDTNILSYNDAFEISKYAIPAMQWACGAGIIRGDAGNLMPTDGTQRCQATAMLIRFRTAVGG